MHNDLKASIVAIKCNKCQRVVASLRVHDLVHCDCGAVAIDGGREYTRIIGDRDDWDVINIRVKPKRKEV